MNMVSFRTALCAAGLLCLFGLVATYDAQAEADAQRRIEHARGEFAGRGVCGTGWHLAYLAEGYACLHYDESGRVHARPAFDSPIRIAGGSEPPQ